jgi:gliding motility-associated-like protein
MCEKVVKITIVLLVTAQGGWCQNLVNNSSFERGVGSLCNHMVWATDYGHYVFDWECPTAGTSDIFDEDIPNQQCWAAMPGKPGGVYNRIGSQLPRTSSRFAGIYVYRKDNGYREYLHAELKTKLVQGKTYCAEMYVSLADRVQIATNNLGMAFTTKRIRYYTLPNNGDFFFTHLKVVPQVLETNVIQDSVSWVKINNSFLADSAYSHLTIGNFFSNENTQTVAQPGRSSFWNNIGYYFVEDVSVTELDIKTIPFTGDAIICQGNTSTLTVNSTFEDVEWTTLSDPNTVIKTGSVLTVNPEVTTSYRVSGKICKHEVIDTVEIKVIPFVNPSLGKDTTICEGTSLTINAGGSYHEYEWQDHSTASEFSATKEGTYSVTVKNESGCSGYDEVRVSVMAAPHVELGEDVVVCNEFPNLKASDFPYSYRWSTGETESAINPSSAGKYWVTADNICGTASDTIRIFSYDQVFIPNVITPNNDPANDVFQIRDLPPSINPTLIVTNRWGKEVVTRINYQGDWPDSKEREELPNGVYYYSVIIPGCKTYKGWLHIFR